MLFTYKKEVLTTVMAALPVEDTHTFFWKGKAIAVESRSNTTTPFAADIKKTGSVTTAGFCFYSDLPKQA